MEEVDKDCPLKGDQEIRKEVDIPKEIPPVWTHSHPSQVYPLLALWDQASNVLQGTYTVLADVYSKDNKRITCLEATTHFGL